MRIEFYLGFVLSATQEGSGFHAAIAQEDGNIFSLGDARSRCFYTALHATQDEAVAAARQLAQSTMLSSWPPIIMPVDKSIGPVAND